MRDLVAELRLPCGLSSLDEERMAAAAEIARLTAEHDEARAERDALRDELEKIASGRLDWYAMRKRAALALTEKGADAQPPALSRTGEGKE